MPLLLMWLFACSPEDESPPLQAVLGTGDWQWESLQEGDDIAVIMGPQGGYHLLGSLRVSGIEPGDPKDLSHPDNPTTRFSVWFEERNLTENAVFVQGLDPVSEDMPPYAFEMLGRFAILDILDDDELDGVELRFEVEVQDVHGNLASDSYLLKAYSHPNNG